MKTAPKKKVLFTSHVANFQKFNRPFMRMLSEQGWEVHYASAGEEKILDCDKEFTVPFERSPFKPGNIKAYFKLKKIIDHEKYDLIHTHTPMGSVVTRLAARTVRKKGTRVIYTAHGFHFFKGAPLLNWIIYFPIEKFMSRYTDTLITINNEDFERAKKKFKTDVQYVPGVGVNLKKFYPSSFDEKNKLRDYYGFQTNDFLLTYPAELNSNKNQSFLIRCMPEILKHIPSAKLILCGTGWSEAELKKMIIQFNLEKSVYLMGYRNDLDDLLRVSDVGVASSLREGLPLNVIESLATGLAILASDNRGHRSITKDSKTGLLFSQQNDSDYISKILSIYQNLPEYIENRFEIANNADQYSLKNILSIMIKLYLNDNSKKQAGR